MLYIIVVLQFTNYLNYIHANILSCMFVCLFVCLFAITLVVCIRCVLFLFSILILRVQDTRLNS